MGEYGTDAPVMKHPRCAVQECRMDVIGRCGRRDPTDTHAWCSFTIQSHISTSLSRVSSQEAEIPVDPNKGQTGVRGLANKNLLGWCATFSRETAHAEALQGYEYEIRRIEVKVAPPQPTWLDTEAEQPFQPEALHPGWSLGQ